MASLIPGYEYDIFISYRQKDNRHDGWVTEFVDNLKGELESTFKEDISVYFDINPHDGLLETHDVGASLKDKLKCLVFIPIISRTYCDPKSFAWEYEFKAFIEQASQDQFGLKVKLPNGNVANRVLPVRIHDLDASDIKECESVLGGVLRGIEFIYKEPGIDKPLALGDNEKKNLNNTTYRIQVIKVARGIKEIISGLRTAGAPGKEIIPHTDPTEEIKREVRSGEKSVGLYNRKLIIGGVVLGILLMITAILAYPKIFQRDTVERLQLSGERISVAVMPFQNMTNDTTWNVWQKGIQDMLTTDLANSPDELKVRQTLQINTLIQSQGLTDFATMTPSLASKISKNLEANIFISGSIKQAGTKIRVNAELIDTQTKEPLRSFEIEDTAEEEKIFLIIDSLKTQIKNFLVISNLKKGTSFTLQRYGNTNSPEAYRLFLNANEAVMNADPATAMKLYKEAIAIDSNFVAARLYMVTHTMSLGLYTDAKAECLKIYMERDRIPMIYRANINWLYACLFETPLESIKYLRQEIQSYGDQAVVYYLLGSEYLKLQKYDKAIPEYEKAFNLRKEWGENSGYGDYTSLGFAYHKTGQYKKEKRLYKKAEREFPDNLRLLYRQSILYLTIKDTDNANRYISKFISILNDRSVSEAVIDANLASIYSEGGVLDKAEEYYRQALSREPGNPNWLNSLAWFLINNDLNINEGLELVDRALKLSPEDYDFLDTKGWGLFKNGKTEEALETLQKSWDLRRKLAVYDHEAFLHLEAARKADAGGIKYQ